MIKFDKDEFLNSQIYSTNDEYKTRCRVTNEVINDVKELQQRIEKAIEYIKYALDDEKETPSKYHDWRLDILEILKGGNNE